MLVCQDCGSHRIVETGGVDLVAACPKCGLPVREGDSGVSNTEADGLSHGNCPDPEDVTPVVKVSVDQEVPTRQSVSATNRQDIVFERGIVAEDAAPLPSSNTGAPLAGGDEVASGPAGLEANPAPGEEEATEENTAPVSAPEKSENNPTIGSKLP